MLALPHTNSWGFQYSNQDNGSTTPGTSITPGASDAEGSFTEIGPDANITTDIYYCRFWVSDGVTAGNAKNHLLDMAYDPTGGTTYDKFLFSDLAVGNTTEFSLSAGGCHFHFPCKIPAGSAIAARIQGSNGTAGTVRVGATFYGKPSRPELWRPAAYSETLGYSSGSLGTSFTPGNAAWGTWASLGTTTKKHFWAQTGVQINNATMSGHGTHVQMGIGDGTNMHIINDFFMNITTAERINCTPQNAATWDIPSGATLYIRGNNSAAPVTGYNATVALWGG